MTIDDRLVARFGLLHIQLDRVRALNGLAEDALNRHDVRIDQWYSENLKRDPDDARFIEYLRNVQKEDVTQAYPLLFRSALFATAYGALEFFLVSVCRHLEGKVSGPLIDDLKGEGIARAQLYLTKVARISFPETNEWHELLLYGRLRNALVHAQGDLSGNRHVVALRNLAGRVRTFDLVDDDRRIELRQSFTPTFVDTVETFSGQLDHAVASHIHAS